MTTSSKYTEDGYLNVFSTEVILGKIREKVAAGEDVVDAINKTARTSEAYAAALKEYGLKPDPGDED